MRQLVDDLVLGHQPIADLVPITRPSHGSAALEVAPALPYFPWTVPRMPGRLWKPYKGPYALTPHTVELIPTLGALSPRGGPVQDPVLTQAASPRFERCQVVVDRVSKGSDGNKEESIPGA